MPLPIFLSLFSWAYWTSPSSSFGLNLCCDSSFDFRVRLLPTSFFSCTQCLLSAIFYIFHLTFVTHPLKRCLFRLLQALLNQLEYCLYRYLGHSASSAHPIWLPVWRSSGRMVGVVPRRTQRSNGLWYAHRLVFCPYMQTLRHDGECISYHDRVWMQGRLLV